MPCSAKYFEGKNANEVLAQIEALGFSNVSCQVSLEKMGLFDKENTVEQVMIGGNSTFKKGGYFNKETVIVIYYFSE